jgi:hypothetical protein
VEYEHAAAVRTINLARWFLMSLPIVSEDLDGDVYEMQSCGPYDMECKQSQ